MTNNWRIYAACGSSDPDLWFPRSGNSPEQAQALAVCASCPVRLACLAFAVQMEIDFGVWGGVTAVDRRPNRKRPRRGKGVRDATRKPCGTPAGYTRHRRRQEDACARCAAAEHTRVTLRNAERRERQGAAAAALERAAG